MIVCITEYDSQARDGRQAGKSLRDVGLRVQAIDGFISMDDFQSQTRPQKGEF